MVANSKSFVRSISMTVILSIIFTALCPMAIFSASETIPTETITVTNAGFDGEVATIEGSVSTGEKAYLKLDVKKDGVDFYTENFYTEADGTFSVDFSVSVPQSGSNTYSYTLSELKGEDVDAFVHTQDFSETLPAYTVNTGSVNSLLGNSAPSYQLGSAKRLLYSHSSAITSGLYTVEADLYFENVPASNGNIFMTTNAAGSSAGADNGANAHYAYIIDVNSGNLRIRYSDTNVKANQTATNNYAVVLSDIAEETWYKVKIVMNLDTYEMQVYLNGERVLESTDLYIFAQKNYTRIFDTSSGARPEVYIDNINIYNTTPGKLFGIASKTGEMVYNSPAPSGNLSYQVENGVLRISGTGEMDDYASFDATPWNDEVVTDIVISEGVTSVAANAFSGFENLGKVRVAESVATIEEGSFPDYNFKMTGFYNSGAHIYAKANSNIDFRLEKFRVLSIGNGHTEDYTAWKDNIIDDMENAGLETEFVYDIACRDEYSMYKERLLDSVEGAGYRSHYKQGSDSSSSYYDWYADYLDNNTYDLVIIQDYMESSLFEDGEDETDFVENLELVLAWLRSRQPNAEIAWLVDWTDLNSSSGVRADIVTNYENSTAECIAAVESMSDGPDRIIPMATAMQNARSSYLGATYNAADCYSHESDVDWAWQDNEITMHTLLERDGTQCSYELGRYLVGVYVYGYLYETYKDVLDGADFDYFNCLQTMPETTHTSTQGVWNGEVTDSHMDIIKESAKNALLTPNMWTQSIYTTDPANEIAEEIENLFIDDFTAEGIKEAVNDANLGITITTGDILVEGRSATITFLYGYSKKSVTITKSGTIDITGESISDNKAKIDGIVSFGKKTYLNLNVKKTGQDYYSESFWTDNNGSFSVEFDVDAVGNDRQTYTYTISEILPETVVTPIHTQDFYGTLPAYTADTGSVDGNFGNDAPAYKLESTKRLLYTHSSAIDSGTYTIAADIYFPDETISDGNIFMSTNAAGNLSLVETINTANVAYGYLVEVNSGALKIKYCDNSTEQTTVQSATIINTVAKETWYNIKVKLNTDTYELEVYLNGERVLGSVPMYAFAQKNYTRIFDTSNGARGTVYIDNLEINNVVEGSLLGIEDKAGSLIQYGITDHNNAISAVNGANNETIIGVLDANKDIIGIDISKYYGFDDAGRDKVETDMTSSPDYNTLEDIRTAYNEVCSYVDIKAATGANLKDKLKMNASILNIELSEEFYDDADIIGCIYANISYASDFDTLKTLVLEGNDLFKLKNLDTSDLSSAKSFMAKYGYNVDYDACNDDIKNAIKTEADNFTLDYSKKPIENLKLWATAINAAYVNARKINSDYVINVSEYKVTDNKIAISGSVEPKVKYNFVAVASQNGIEKGRALFSTDAEGKFSCTITLPVSRNDIEYTVKIEAVVPEEDPIYLFKEYFDGTETNSYTMSDGVDIVDDIGTPVPALKVSKETGEERARQLATVAEIASLTEGILCIKADFMKPEKSASTIYRVADNNGSTNAITLASDNEGKVTLTYLDASNVPVIKDLILADDFEVNKWYSLSIKIDTQTNEAIITIDDVKYNFTLGISAINLTRAFDTIATGTGIHYIDNVVIYQDKAERINSSVEVMNVLVYGTDAISATIEAVTNASPETMESVLLSNNHILKLDLTASGDFNNLADDSSVVSALANKQTFSGVNEICKIFYGETALQKMKESADNTVKATTLEKYSSYIGINKSDVLKNNSIYLSLLGSNINSANNMAELKVVSNKITLAASIMSATQFTIKGVIDNNVTALVNLGLNDEYSSLTSDEKKTVSGAVFDVDLSETNINNLLSAIVQKVNDAITDLPDGDLPGGSGGAGSGGGSAGGRPAGSASGNASGGTIAIAPGNAETITPQPSKTFDDVSSGHWAYEAIEYLASKGIVAGKGQRKFEPDVTVKREEFVKMIIVSLGVELKTGEGVFEDVPADVWYSNYVNTAVDLGIVNGISEKHFGSGIDVSRQDAVTILYRCKDSLNSGLIESREYHEFDDANEISGYAKKAVEYFYECSVINGINEQVFAPTKSLTRAEAAKMLYEIIRR